MKKPLLTIFLTLLTAQALADASVDARKTDKTYLLNAPGTLTGTVKGSNPDDNVQSPVATHSTLPERQQQQQTLPPAQQQYRYVEENDRKFRQFGQTSGQNNPWFDERNSRYAKPRRQMIPPPITNPWQLGGMPAAPGMVDPQPGNSMQPYSRYGNGNYSTGNRLYPDYPADIYRDTNPALLGMPGQGGFLPGFDGSNFPFPMSPFGMF